MGDMTWDLIGHLWAIDLLRGHIRAHRVRHAYLFTGPRGVGRRTLALRFAQALMCPTPVEPGVPCGTCSTCRRLDTMQHPDLFVVQAEREGGVLRVEQVRELQRHLALAPYEGPYRLALLLRFEEAHPAAANALLKTLEEPPVPVVLMLTAESAEALLPTIVSRCEVLRLRPLPPEEVAAALQARYGLSAVEARRLAHLAGGRPGQALRWHQQPEHLAQREEHLQALLTLLPASHAERFGFAYRLTRSNEGAAERVRALLLTWLDFWRDVMLRALGDAAPRVNLDREEVIAQLATQVPAATAVAFVERLQQALYQLERHVNTRLLLEVVLLDLPRVALPASVLSRGQGMGET